MSALQVSAQQSHIFRAAMDALEAAGIPYSVGGGLALYVHTGIRRQVHDFDIHVVPGDIEPAMEALRSAGFKSWVQFPQWLAQAERNGVQVDMVFGQGSWHASADQGWIEGGPRAEVLDHEVNVIPAEELIWSKGMRCSRFRYDASDVFHLFAALADRLDWPHLIERFGEDWEVLLSHLLMFRYVFPRDAQRVPRSVWDQLLGGLATDLDRSGLEPLVCRGALLDSADPYDQYFYERGYRDEREERWQQRLRAETDELEPLVEQDVHDAGAPGGIRAAS
ncbi:MAG: nucleotidyltransferase domain-containing protein [Chloroflexota bacterium]